MLTAEKIINAKHYSDIFVADIYEIKRIYREAVKKYHPDVNKSISAVNTVMKLNTLYEQALEALENKSWTEGFTIILNNNGITSYTFKYISEYDFELGKIYLTENSLIYLLDLEHISYYRNYLNIVLNLKYLNSDMEKEISRYIPNIKKYEIYDNHCMIELVRTSDIHMLSDILLEKNGSIASEHIAWMLSRLNNILCFLRFNNLVHNGITLENCLVSPKYHTILLYGGWWYCVPEGGKLIGTTKSVYDVMSVKSKTDKIGEYRTDIESMKVIGKRLYGSKYSELNYVPVHVLNWLESGSGNDALEEYKKWDTVLTKTWGVRRFVDFEVNINNIYNKKVRI